MINNEYKYLQQLEDAMQKFLNQDVSGDIGAIADEVARLMAEAAFNVLKTIEATTTFMEKQTT